MKTCREPELCSSLELLFVKMDVLRVSETSLDYSIRTVLFSTREYRTNKKEQKMKDGRRKRT
jgi:hypothetical protein